MTQKKIQYQLTVYYDGLCYLCSKEIDHYRKLAGSEKIDFKDITEFSFDAKSEGVDPFAVHRVMHAKTKDGILRTEVDAFVAIWELLPKYRFAASLAQKKGFRLFMNFGYDIFAFIRPYLPKKTRDCATSPYCELRKNP